MDSAIPEMSDFTRETIALIDYLQSRGLEEPMACAVMGAALAALIGNKSTQRSFLSSLAATFDRGNIPGDGQGLQSGAAAGRTVWNHS